jgi:hypothetical protein
MKWKAQLSSFARLDSPFDFAQGGLRRLSLHDYGICPCGASL